MLRLSEFKIKEYIAHEGELLKDHLLRVAQENEKLGQTIKIEGKSLSDFFFLIGIFHDTGKYTKVFQYYIKSQIEKNDIVNLDDADIIDKYSQHAIFGAILYFWFVGANYSFFKSKGFKDGDIKVIIIAGMYAIMKHHGNLENIEDIIEVEKINKQISIVGKQAEFMNLDIVEKEYNELLSGIGLRINLTEFKKFINHKNVGNSIIGFCKNVFSDKLDSHLFKVCYSSLIYSDKYKTIFQNKKVKHKNILPGNLVDKYRDYNFFDKTNDDLNKFRNRIYHEVNNNLNNLSIDKHIYTLNAPTGAGKTFNLLNIGLKLKEKLLKEKNIKSKIVYGLPFTSIIDQVVEETRKILKVNGFDENDGKLLLKHHHLSEVEMDNGNDEFNLDYNQQRFFMDSWESEIIITTFFQIFHTIFGNKNKWLVKFPSFQNTIFLLDEIQATPYKYWGNFKDIFKQLSEKYNCYFVLSSATLPLLVDKKLSIELLPGYKKYFTEMNRTKLDLSLLDKDRGIEDIYVEIKMSLEENLQKDHLITLNTIKSSVKIFQKIKSDFDNGENIFFYLSTNIIPLHRIDRIKKIKEKVGKRKIIVSTQMIEAGVDIDLDIGFRDRGPIDSIVQILGRLNRNGKKSYKGVLKLFKLIDEDNNWKNNNSFASYVYDKLRLDITNYILKRGKIIIEEKNYQNLFNLYFEYIDSHKSNDIEKKIKDDLNNSKFYDVNNEFKLIDNLRKTIDIFIAIDGNAKQLREKKENLWKTYPDKRERKQARGKMKKDFGQYIISVDEKKVEKCGFNNKQLEFGQVCLKDEMLERFYKEDIGFDILDKNQDLNIDNFI